MTATVTSVTDNGDSSFTVAGTVDSTADVTVYRQTDAAALIACGTVHGNSSASTSAPASWSFTDYFAPTTGSVTYSADDGSNASGSDSGGFDPSTGSKQSVDASSGGWWLRDASMPSLSRQITPQAGDPEFVYDQERGIFWPIGATHPTVVLGESRLMKIVPPPLMVFGQSGLNALVALCARGVLNLATDTGATYWVVCSKSPDVSEPSGSLRGDNARLMLASVEFTPVAAPSGVA